MWDRIFPMELGGILLLVLVNFFLTTRKPSDWYDLKPTILILVLCWGFHVLTWNAIPIFHAIGRIVSTGDFFYDESVAVAFVAGVLLEVVIILVIRVCIVKKPIRTFFRANGVSRDLVKGLAIFLIALSFFYAIRLLIKNVDYRIGDLHAADSNLSSILVILITSLIAAPVLEETIFRGFLMFTVQRSIGISAALVITSLAWALFHTDGHFIGYLINGTILALLYIKTKSLISPIMLHAAYNLSYMLKWLTIS